MPLARSNQILEHIALCNEKLSSYVDAVAPPSYEEAMSTNSSSASDQERWTTTNSLSYNELGAVLENLKAETQSQSAQMIYSCENVTLYYISPSGAVSVSSGPDTVRIFEMEGWSIERKRGRITRVLFFGLFCTQTAALIRYLNITCKFTYSCIRWCRKCRLVFAPNSAPSFYRT